jgi:hypothetical protein
MDKEAEEEQKKKDSKKVSESSIPDDLGRPDPFYQEYDRNELDSNRPEIMGDTHIDVTSPIHNPDAPFAVQYDTSSGSYDVVNTGSGQIIAPSVASDPTGAKLISDYFNRTFEKNSSRFPTDPESPIVERILENAKKYASKKILENINAANWPVDSMGQYKGKPLSTDNVLGTSMKDTGKPVITKGKSQKDTSKSEETIETDESEETDTKKESPKKTNSNGERSPLTVAKKSTQASATTDQKILTKSQTGERSPLTGANSRKDKVAEPKKAPSFLKKEKQSTAEARL